MKKYSVEWKNARGVWVQKHYEGWKIHYIENNSEYATGCYFTKSAALEEIKNYK